MKRLTLPNTHPHSLTNMDFSLTSIIAPNQKKISKVKDISDMSVYEPSRPL